MKKFIAIVCVTVLMCFCLTGCEYWQDENGKSHFMLFGERGPSKDGKKLTEEELSSPVDSIDNDNGQPSTSQSNDSIKASSLKKGWTVDDNSILRGENVSVTGETEIFAITLKEDKEVSFNLNAKLESGDYEIVLILPDKSERILYHSDLDIEPQKVTLEEGVYSIWIRCESVLFKSIDLTIDGLNASDF